MIDIARFDYEYCTADQKRATAFISDKNTVGKKEGRRRRI